jgi:Bacterial Ig domain/EF hand
MTGQATLLDGTGPVYLAVPLEAGALMPDALGFITIDASGQLVARGQSPSAVIFMNLATGVLEYPALELSSTGGPELSADGRYFFFKGTAAGMLGVVAFDRQTQNTRLVYPTISFLFSATETGNLVALQTDYESPRGQYVLTDTATGEVRRLTDDPKAILQPNNPNDCPYVNGTTPMINAAGTRVAFATRATLGLVESDPGVGCHVVVYEIERHALRYVIGLPKELTLAGPAISADGRWFSFTTSRPTGSGRRRSTAALLDLETGAFVESVLGPPGQGDQTFESIVTADGAHVVLASSADLDPRVGNADHNMELFILDRATGEVRQVTDTTGAIGVQSGSCNFPEFDVNRDGGAIAVLYPSAGGEKCRYDGPPRHRSTGLYYRLTRIVKKRPGNQGPLWDPPAEATVDAGRTLTVDFAATDPDGDRLTFFAQAAGDIDLPRGASFEDHRDGTARFVWPTRVEQAGAYQVRFAVFDEGGGERVQDVTIVIRPRGGAPCAADCNGDGQVTVDELVTGVRAALGQAAVDVCPPADVDGDGAVTVEELIRATGDALGGCAPAAQ